MHLNDTIVVKKTNRGNYLAACIPWDQARQLDDCATFLWKSAFLDYSDQENALGAARRLILKCGDQDIFDLDEANHHIRYGWHVFDLEWKQE